MFKYLEAIMQHNILKFKYEDVVICQDIKIEQTGVQNQTTGAKVLCSLIEHIFFPR